MCKKDFKNKKNKSIYHNLILIQKRILEIYLKEFRKKKEVILQKRIIFLN